MNNLAPAVFENSDAHGLNLHLTDGSQMQIQALEPALFRVRVRPAAGYREPRTWAIAPVSCDETPGAVRQDVPWEGRSRDDTTGFSLPAVSIDQQGDTAMVSTAALQVTISLKTLALTWRDVKDAECATIAQDRATSAYFASQRTGAVRHYLQRAPGDCYYGLGDKTGPLDLHGRRLRTVALDSLGYDPQAGDPLYKHWPFVLTHTESGAWYGLYYDTLAACIFDLGCEHDNYHGLYRYVEIDDGDLDYYFIAGASPAEVIASYVRLIGGTHLPPRWSLGYAQTAMGLADAPDAQVQLDAFITRAAKEAVPVSSFHYGSGYSSRGARRYVFTWNTSKFPDPKALNARFQQAGMRLVANVKPCLLDDHPDYATVKKIGGFIHDATTHEPVIGQFWDGVGAHLDFSNPDTIA